jgi:hypothetical protein
LSTLSVRLREIRAQLQARDLLHSCIITLQQISERQTSSPARLVALMATFGLLFLIASLPIHSCNASPTTHGVYLDLIRYSQVPGTSAKHAAYLVALAEAGRCRYCGGSGRASAFRLSVPIVCDLMCGRIPI